jgi:hypothetical protein
MFTLNDGVIMSGEFVTGYEVGYFPRFLWAPMLPRLKYFRQKINKVHDY